MLQLFKEGVRSNTTLFQLGLPLALPYNSYKIKMIVRQLFKYFDTNRKKNSTLQNHNRPATKRKLLHYIYNFGKDIHSNSFQISKKKALAQKLYYSIIDVQLIRTSNKELNIFWIEKIKLIYKLDYFNQKSRLYLFRQQLSCL